MDKYLLEKDIKVFYVTAESFPDGIQASYKKLQAMLPEKDTRKFFGLSSPDKTGKIIYKAAVEESYEGEGKKLECDEFTIKKGEYLSVVIKDFMENIPAIGEAFQKLITDPGIDPEGLCVEMYEGKDVRCIVKLK